MSEQQSTANRKPGVPYEEILEMMDRVLTDKYRSKQQAAFLQVQGPSGHRLYVALQPEVRRIDVAFDPGWAPSADSPYPEGFIRPRKPNGSVHMELDCADPAALSRLEQLLVWMADAPAIVQKKRQAFVPQLPAIAQKKATGRQRASTAPDAQTAEDAAERAARKERLRKFADERGVEISPNAKID